MPTCFSSRVEDFEDEADDEAGSLSSPDKWAKGRIGYGVAPNVAHQTSPLKTPVGYHPGARRGAYKRRAQWRAKANKE